MKIGLLDASYKQENTLGLGMSWLRWELAQLGVEPASLATADVVLASVQSQQAVGDLARELRRNNINPATRLVIIGGAGAYAPAVFSHLCSGACVGEGRQFAQTLVRDGVDAAMGLPEVWRPGQTAQVVPNTAFPWDCPPIRYQDGTTRLWASRGCRRKCLFCQTGWEQPYRQNPDMDAVYCTAQALHKRGERPFFTSNDQSELDWQRIPPVEHMSASVVGLRRLLSTPGILRKARSIRVGVEGPSERLRAAVGKPIATGELLDLTRAAMAQGITFRWFMIAGLPGEVDADYDELKDAVLYIKRNCAKGVVMMHFHAFIPHPATPLCVLPLTDDYWGRFEEFRRWFFHGPGGTARVQIMPCAQPQGRMKRACQSMAATSDQVRRGWFEQDNPNWCIKGECDTERRRRLAQRYWNRVAARCDTDDQQCRHVGDNRRTVYVCEHTLKRPLPARGNFGGENAPRV